MALYRLLYEGSACMVPVRTGIEAICLTGPRHHNEFCQPLSVEADVFSSYLALECIRQVGQLVATLDRGTMGWSGWNVFLLG